MGERIHWHHDEIGATEEAIFREVVSQLSGCQPSPDDSSHVYQLPSQAITARAFKYPDGAWYHELSATLTLPARPLTEVRTHLYRWDPEHPSHELTRSFYETTTLRAVNVNAFWSKEASPEPSAAELAMEMQLRIDEGESVFRRRHFVTFLSYILAIPPEKWPK